MAKIFDRILLLKNSTIFSEVAVEDLQVVAQALDTEFYVKGDRIFDINEQGDRMYMIHTGKIGISTNANPEVKEFVATLGPGEFFGEMNLLDDLPRSATAYVLEDAELFSIERGKLRNLVINYPELSFGMLKSLSMRLRNTNELLNEARQNKSG
ncbi:Crp/Fnr family transcriptional regulator [Kaarinaea lacus]